MSKTSGMMNLFIVFIAIMLIAFFAIGFSSTITAPSNTTSAGQQYNNLSKVITISSSGLQGVILLLITAMILSVAYLVYNVGKRR